MAIVKVELTPASQEWLETAKLVHEKLKEYPQAAIHTDHAIHGGMYARTIRIKAGTTLLGSVVDKPTILIVNGTVSILSGEKETHLEGYNVLLGSAHRQQLVYAHTDVQLTMIAATELKTVWEIENEVFFDPDLLMSRHDPSGDTIQITGE